MKRFFVSAVAALLLMSSYVMAADTVLSGDIKEADGTTFQNTNTGSGVKTGHIQDNAITTPKINNGAVTTQKIVNEAITNLKIAPGAVISGKIADGAVTGPKLGAGSVGTTKVANGAITAPKLDPALYSALLGNQINVYDKNNLLVGAVLDSAQDLDSPIFGNQIYILMRSGGGVFYGLRAGSQFFVSIADVRYSGTGCSGTAYSTEDLTKYMIQPAHVGFNPGTSQLFSFIEPAGTVGQTNLYRSTASFNTSTNMWVCTTHSAAFSAVLYTLTAANNLSGFVVPFHVAQ